jgi:nitroimidazol reductase NimA-like FMN-containing flavoprotein (pyridoxamine 5'-phosphate oxidase superfamily)
MADTRMSEQERQSFLADLHVGVLSVPRQNGAPLAAPIWYDYQPGGEIWVLVGKGSLKAKLLSEGAGVTLVAQQEAIPYAYVSVEGTITEIRAADKNADTLPMAVRYLGDEMGAGYAQANAESDSLRVSIRADRWLTVDYAKTMG